MLLKHLFVLILFIGTDVRARSGVIMHISGHSMLDEILFDLTHKSCIRALKLLLLFRQLLVLELLEGTHLHGHPCHRQSRRRDSHIIVR